MADYEMTERGFIRRKSDGAVIPEALGNKDYDEFVVLGCVADPYVPPPPSSNHVNTERDRRVASGFPFGGKLYQCRPDDQMNISGSSILASLAIGAGVQPGNLRWHGGDTDFVWIADDNSLVPMDAQTVIAFGQAAATWKSAHVFAARTLKDMTPIPADFADGSYWPELA